MNETVTPYPFTAETDREEIESATKENMQKLLNKPLFDGFDREKLLSSFDVHYSFVNMLFNEEEELRTLNSPGANLYYHGRPHSVHQVTYDAITIASAILERDDEFSKHISPEGTVSIVFGAMFHDTGYVSDGPVDNYAARTSVHVEESKKMLDVMVNLLGFPKDLDREKVKRLGRIGIHGTYFPFTQTRREESQTMINGLPVDERKEAQIIRLAVQLADLGGQCARPDYFPTQVLKLRDELNAADSGTGTKVIGSDHELQANCEQFLAEYVLHQPLPKRNVETTALAFFGQEKSKLLRNAWR